MGKNVENTKTKANRHDASEEKAALPVFVKYGLIAVAVIAAIVIGIIVYFNVAGGYVAIVDGEKIRTSEFNYYLEAQKQNMFLSAYAEDANITEETFWAAPIGGENPVEVAKKMTLDSLKEIKIQLNKAKEAKVELTSSDRKSIEEYIQESIKQTMGIDNKVQANNAFQKQYGISKDDFVKTQLDQYTVRQYQSSEITKIPDADADVETYYNKNPGWYKEDTQMRIGAEEAVWARHILIATDESMSKEELDAAKKKAEDLIAQLKNGADFATLARENSEDPGSTERGGDYLFGKGQMHKEFEDAAFALKPGEITQTPVQTTSGYHILKLEEKYAQDEPVSLNCAKNYYEYSGTSFVKYKLYMEKVAGWINEADVKLNSSVYNSIK